MRQTLATIIIGALTSVGATTLAQENPPDTPEAMPLETDLCEGVSCSGHGHCIVVRGEPACACEEGFQADAVGINCIAATTTGDSDRSSQQEDGGLSPQQTEAIANLDPPRRDLDGFKLWLPGLILGSVGIAAIAAGTVILSFMYYPSEDAEDDSVGSLGVGLGLSLGGFSVWTAGLVMAMIGARRMNRDRVRRLVQGTALRLSPLVGVAGNNGAVWGVSGRF